MRSIELFDGYTSKMSVFVVQYSGTILYNTLYSYTADIRNTTKSISIELSRCKIRFLRSLYTSDVLDRLVIFLYKSQSSN